MPGCECTASQSWSEEIALHKKFWKDRRAVHEDCMLCSRSQSIALLSCVRPGLSVIR